MNKNILVLILLLFFVSQFTFTQNFTHVTYTGYEFQSNDVLVSASPSRKMYRGDFITSNLGGSIDTLRIFSFMNNGVPIDTTDITGYVEHAAMEATDERIYLNIEMYNVIIYPISLPGIGTISTGGFSHGTLFVALTPDLEVEWYEFFGSNTFNGFWQCDITFLNNGNILFNTWEDHPDYYLYVKMKEFTPDGDFVDEFTQTELVYTMVEDSEGSLYITGPCANEEAVFNGTEVSFTFAYNLYIVKYDVERNYVWSNFVEDVTCSFTDLAVNSEDEIFLFAPLIEGEYYFDDHLLEVSSYLHYSIARLDDDGNFSWAKTISEGIMGNNSSTNIIQNSYVKSDLNGNMLICGSVQGEIIWNNGEEYSDPKSKPFVAQINNSGIVDWVTVAEEVYTFGRANHLDWSESGCLVIGGTSVVSIQFDTIQIYYDGFISYMARMQLDNPATNILENSHQSFHIYPNPVLNKLNISMDDRDENFKELLISGLDGRTLITKKIVEEEIISINLENLRSGMYLINLIGDKQFLTAKFLKY